MSGGAKLATTLIDRKHLCEDTLLRERVQQAILESGKTLTLNTVMAGIVATLDTIREVGDDEIVAFIGAQSATS